MSCAIDETTGRLANGLMVTKRLAAAGSARSSNEKFVAAQVASAIEHSEDSVGQDEVGTIWPRTRGTQGPSKLLQGPRLAYR